MTLPEQALVPPYPPPGLSGLRGTGFEEDQAANGHQKTYLGPAIPSMEKERGGTLVLPKDLRIEQLELQNLLSAELQKVHQLEDSISLRVFGTHKDAPVSLLDHQEVVYATQDPTLLAPDTKSQISVMKQVLEMMKTAKKHHLEVLGRLEDPPAPAEQQGPQSDPRRSLRTRGRSLQNRNKDFVYY